MRGANEPLTAYPRTEAYLRHALASAPIHLASLNRRLRRCDLRECKGMCCYDGIYLGAEEAEVVSAVAQHETRFFQGIGLHLPRLVVVQGQWENLAAGPKTAVAPWPGSSAVADFPAHFHDTACVFHLPDGRCGLQALSVARGRHPWYYKPTGCWLHPLAVDMGDPPGLGLPDQDTDPFRLSHYDGFIERTRCGATREDGLPAWEVLREELDFLGLIVRRNLYHEISDAGRRVSLKVVKQEDG